MILKEIIGRRKSISVHSLKAIIKCDNCGKEKERKILKTSTHQFCSTKCFQEYKQKHKSEKVLKCELCGKVKVGKKRFNAHHIDYENNITIYVCYSCHQLMHGRSIFYNPWNKYGKDKAFYELSKQFIKVYKRKIKKGNKK